jgi:mRNA interferase HigB
MYVISSKMPRQSWEQHPDSEGALAQWFNIMQGQIIQGQDFMNFEALRATFPTADKGGNLIAFNIGGNKYRTRVTDPVGVHWAGIRLRVDVYMPRAAQ